MEYTIKSKKKEPEMLSRDEQITTNEILELDDFVNDTLFKVSNWDMDIEEAKDYIMYKFIKFTMHHQDEKVLNNFSWKYFNKNKSKLMKKIP